MIKLQTVPYSINAKGVELSRKDGDYSHNDLQQEMLSCGDMPSYRYAAVVNGQLMELMWIPDVGRAGVAHGADAQWTDADAPAQALARYLNDEMVG